MDTLFTVMRYEMFFVFVALASIVGYRMLTGHINTKGAKNKRQSSAIASVGAVSRTLVAPVFHDGKCLLRDFHNR